MRELLARHAPEMSFFQAVQILQRLAPDAVAVGGLGPPEREAIRFVHDPQLIFHTGDVASIEPRVVRNGHVFSRITSTFLGLFGTASPLAAHLSEDVIRAEAADDTSLKAFYDLFHHRLLSLFFRAWKKYRFDAGFRTDGFDPPTKRALAFVGFDAWGAPPSAGLPPMYLLSLAPLIAQRPRSARILKLVLERMFPGVPVRVQSFVRRRVAIPREQRVSLGVANTTVGTDFTIGRTVLDRAGRFRIAMGPLDYATFETLLPTGSRHTMVRRVVEQFTRGFLEAELELRVAENETPRFQLGSRRGARLAVTTQLHAGRTKPMRVRVILSEHATEVRTQVVDEERPAERRDWIEERG